MGTSTIYSQNTPGMARVLHSDFTFDISLYNINRVNFRFVFITEVLSIFCLIFVLNVFMQQTSFLLFTCFYNRNFRQLGPLDP